MATGDGVRSIPAAGRPLVRYAQYGGWALATAALLNPLSTAAMLAQPLIARNLIDALDAGRSLTRPVILLTAFVILTAVGRGAALWLTECAGERIVRALRRRMASHLLRLTIDGTDRWASGDLTSRLTADITLVRAGVSRGIVDLGAGVIGVVGATGLMAAIDGRLLVAGLTVIACLLAASMALLNSTRDITRAAQQAVGAIGASLERALVAMRSVKANLSEGRELDRTMVNVDRAYEAGLRGARRRAIASLLAGLSMHMALLVVLGWGGVLVASGDLALSSLIAFLLYTFYLTGPIGAVATGATQIIQALGATPRLLEVEQLPIERDPPVARTTARHAGVPRRPPQPTVPLVVFDDVSFRYRDERSNALTSVSFTVPDRGQTALIGPSGSGKSTAFALLLRFYDPDAGSIRLSAVDTLDMARGGVRQRIAYVAQDAPMLSGTIADSLRYGAPEASPEDLAWALRATRLEDFVGRLPRGLETDIGQRGVALSGGERQRLAIAQALLRRPDLLLLDEATGQLDALNEAALQDTISRTSRTCAVMTIAHRLSTVVHADQTVVLENGRVRAVGNHHELVASDHLYRRFITTHRPTQGSLGGWCEAPEYGASGASI